jgi:Chaperone of endosialidase
MNTTKNFTCPAFAVFAFACFGLLPTARAVSPPPDGGYPGGNTAEGTRALFSLTNGKGNAAVGSEALQSNTTGSQNTATGASALISNTSGAGNTAFGWHALLSNTPASNNTAVGASALLLNTIGIENVALGAFALENSQTGSGNIAIGFSAGTGVTSGSNNIDIANTGATESSTIRIGSTNQTNTYIAGISGVTVAGGMGVIVDSSGHLGTSTSSARYKEKIEPMDKASEAILALKPVSFRYKPELDPNGIPQFGLVAEQVEKVNPDLVVRDRDGKPYTVRYEAVNAMLLNEFLKQHRKVEEQDCKLQEQGAIIARQQKQIEALTQACKK